MGGREETTVETESRETGDGKTAHVDALQREVVQLREILDQALRVLSSGSSLEPNAQAQLRRLRSHLGRTE